MVLSSPAAPFSVSAFLLPVYYPPSRPSCKMLDSRTQLWAPPMTASLLLFIFFWPHHRAYEILVPPPEIEPTSPTLEGWSLNYWSTKEVPTSLFFMVSMQAEKSVANTDYFFWKRKDNSESGESQSAGPGPNQ